MLISPNLVVFIFNFFSLYMLMVYKSSAALERSESLTSDDLKFSSLICQAAAFKRGITEKLPLYLREVQQVSLARVYLAQGETEENEE